MVLGLVLPNGENEFGPGDDAPDWSHSAVHHCLIAVSLID
jgi:hypothetical protein